MIMENMIKIDPNEQIEKITKWIRDWFDENGKTASDQKSSCQDTRLR